MEPKQKAENRQPRRLRCRCDCGAPLKRYVDLGERGKVIEAAIYCPNCGTYLDRVDCFGKQSWRVVKDGRLLHRGSGQTGL